MSVVFRYERCNRWAAELVAAAKNPEDVTRRKKERLENTRFQLDMLLRSLDEGLDSTTSTSAQEQQANTTAPASAVDCDRTKQKYASNGDDSQGHSQAKPIGSDAGGGGGGVVEDNSAGGESVAPYDGFKWHSSLQERIVEKHFDLLSANGGRGFRLFGIPHQLQMQMRKLGAVDQDKDHEASARK